MWPHLQYCMQFVVLHFKNDVDHLEKILKQAIKMIRGMEKKTWCISSIYIGTKNNKKTFHYHPHLPPVNVLLAVYKTLRL